MAWPRGLPAPRCQGARAGTKRCGATLPPRAATDFPALKRRALDTLQVNLGFKCNQSCRHHPVKAAPPAHRDDGCGRHRPGAAGAAQHRVQTLDQTEGAPERNPHCNSLVSDTRAADVGVIDRCNLTILSEPGREVLAGCLAATGVAVTASLHCYSVAHVGRQRGEGVLDRSMAGLQALNKLGYGVAGTGLVPTERQDHT